MANHPDFPAPQPAQQTPSSTPASDPNFSINKYLRDTEVGAERLAALGFDFNTMNDTEGVKVALDAAATKSGYIEGAPKKKK